MRTRSFLKRCTPVAIALIGAIGAWVPRPALAQAFQFTGHVVAASDGSPLQYAVVGVPELEQWALTDESGAFTLDIAEPGVYRLIVLRRGYYLVDAGVNLTPSGGEPVTVRAELETEQPDNPLVPGRIVGNVVDQQNGRPVRDAQVTIQPTGQTTTTDSRGNFEISDISAGAILLQVEALGYATRTDTLASVPGVSLQVSLGVAPEAIPLEPIVVAVRSNYLESVGFYRRERQGLGHTWNRQEIETVRPVQLSDVFRRQPVAGVRVGQGRFGETVLTSARGRGCELSTWLDEVQMPGFDMDTYPWEAVAGLEVYVGSQVPPRYNDPCGVLLIWSARN